MAKQKKISITEDEERDAMDIVNDLPFETFVESFLMDGDAWKSWTHPTTAEEYTLSVETSAGLSLQKEDFEACFKLIEFTSSSDYKKSKDGWKPRSKKKEMVLLDLKYLLVRDASGKVRGFCSFMPTIEDGYHVVYCYEIHLDPSLQGTGMGKILMQYLDIIGSKLPGVTKIMLTVFLSNEKAVGFYKKLCYVKDEFSPAPKVLRNGTQVEAEYAILSKSVKR